MSSPVHLVEESVQQFVSSAGVCAAGDRIPVAIMENVILMIFLFYSDLLTGILSAIGVQGFET